MMIVVQSPILFDEFDSFDALLHWVRHDVSMKHFKCGGTVKVSPAPYKRRLLGRYAPVDGAEHHLTCTVCGEMAGPYSRGTLSRSLGHFLTGPDWETAPAQHLDEVVHFVPPDWPPERRRQEDRRRKDARHTVDSSMEGRRRAAHDRRQNGASTDGP